MDQTPPSQQGTTFFAVSTFKLLVMYVATMGFYEVYWFYRQWAQIKYKERSNIVPLLRSLFGILFSYPLFSRIQKAQQAEGETRPLAAGFWCGVLFLLNACVLLAGPLKFLSFFSILPLLVAQAAANQVNQQRYPQAAKNHQFSQIEIIVILFGGFIWLTSLL